MLGESITVSGKSQAPTVNAMTPAGNQVTQKGCANVKAQKHPELVQTSEIVADVQKNLDLIHDTDLQFSVHGASGKVMVIVRDEDSGEIVREIPLKEALDLAAKLAEMVGLIFDQHG
ncbi:MAG: flagellar protein FlaG [Desulfobacterales bacterium]|nr:flagellar protein FlaG [Desulfobacterales bacterium]